MGVQVLKECIARAGSLEGGLRFYVGAANLPDDGGYAGKVLNEQSHLRQVAAGRSVSVNAPQANPAVPVRASTRAAAGEAPAAAAADSETPVPAKASEQLATLS